MGDFTWRTADTKETISINAPRTVYLLQPHGQPPLAESCYRGFGIFGGVDVFEWLVANNPQAHHALLTSLRKPFIGNDRRDGILLDSIYHGRSPNPWGIEIDHPIKLSYDPNVLYETVDFSLPVDDAPDLYYTE